MARIKDCSEDIANITQEAVLKQNVCHILIATIFKHCHIRAVFNLPAEREV